MAPLLKQLKSFSFLLFLAMIGIFFKVILHQNSAHIVGFFMRKDNLSVAADSSDQIFRSYNITPRDVLRQGNGIIFVETTDRMDEPSLVLCSIESAARMYPDRPVAFFMKGLHDIITEDDEKKARKRFPSLSSYQNIYFFPLRLEKLFANTPFLPWYEKINPGREVHWTYVKADACRLAMIWKYGGIYMDFDMISIQPIPEDNFVAAEHSRCTTNSVFGLPPHHKLSWEFMENFVQNYKGEVWGNQGPILFTRVVNKYCGFPQFKAIDDLKCANVSYLHPERFYPFAYSDWRKYYEVWKVLPTFNNSYALHLWNYMNGEKKSMVVGSNTLIEHLYKQYCPSNYEKILHNVTTHH
ncbi:alpha-1,4-N-acetylglucosaminyltransferase-like [Eleutherodactylus coqui]|uniref:alpha-1,4-N-acetylglucosaminyltransferase-like n=1 Tax=Eleutherodactylus coqui TaxID=57060 RepID=UPI00346216AC